MGSTGRVDGLLHEGDYGARVGEGLLGFLLGGGNCAGVSGHDGEVVEVLGGLSGGRLPTCLRDQPRHLLEVVCARDSLAPQPDEVGL